ncbi:uncharacterized protein LOC143266309 [Megachile rotundata]|uniref:uncharacterized protein LOC143266309 n=1 Tax=Megachile rotundata TaxID=143995 RepID=UPI003FD596C3
MEWGGFYTDSGQREIVVEGSDLTQEDVMAIGYLKDVYKTYKQEVQIESIPQKGQPKKLDIRDERKMIRKVKVNPSLSAPKLADELLMETGKKVHPQTIRKTLKKSGYNGKVARRKPFVNEANRKKRLNYAQEFVLKEDTW